MVQGSSCYITTLKAPQTGLHSRPDPVMLNCGFTCLFVCLSVCLQSVWLSGLRGGLCVSGLCSKLVLSDRAGPELQSSRRTRREAAVCSTGGSTLQTEHPEVHWHHRRRKNHMFMFSSLKSDINESQGRQGCIERLETQLSLDRKSDSLYKHLCIHYFKFCWCQV